MKVYWNLTFLERHSAVASIMTLVAGYKALNTFGIYVLMTSRGGHIGMSFSFKYRKFIQVVNILETVDRSRHTKSICKILL